MKTVMIALVMAVANAESCSAAAQQTAPQPESFEACSRHVQGASRSQTSPATIEGNVRKTVFPDASDLKELKNADVRIRIIIDQTGAVPCAVGAEGDPALFERSVAAAKNWKFAPYSAGGETVILETAFVFHYNKGKVSARFPR